MFSQKNSHHHHHHHHRGQRQGGGGGGSGSGGGYYGSTGSGTGLAGYFPLLTFNLPPQSLLEGAFALAFVVVLAVPLFSRIQKLLEESKRKRQNENNEIVQEIQKMDALLPPTDNPTVVMHYPSRNFMSSVSSSNSSLNLDQSTVRIHEFTDEEFLNEFEAGHRHHNHSSNNNHHHNEKTHAPANVVLEEDDDGAEEEDKIDYKAYRHRLMEEVLKKYYDEQQPPGNVVMNSFCLNTVDDHRDAKACRLDFVAFTDELYSPIEIAKRREAVYTHPMDHFLVRGNTKTVTEEKCVDVMSLERISAPAGGFDEAGGGGGGYCGSDAGNEDDLPRSPRPKVDERPKTGHHAARLPRSAPKPTSGRNTSVRISSMSYPRPPAAAADVLRIDREDSSSDLDSSVNDMHANKSKTTHNSKMPTTTSDGKRPWIAASKGDTANRKYATQDRFTRRWEMRSHQRSATEAHHNQAHHQHQHQAQAQASLESLGSNVASQSTLLLPNRKLTLQEREDRLFGVTRDVDDHNGSSYAMENDKRRPGSSKNKSWDSQMKNQGSVEPVTRKSSRLPLPANSKKPMSASKLLSSDPRRMSITSTESTLPALPAPPTLSSSKPRSGALSGHQRPKTSSGIPAAGSQAWKRRTMTQQSEDKSGKSNKAERRVAIRPRTSDRIDERDNDNFMELDECDEIKPLCWTVKLAEEKNKK